MNETVVSRAEPDPPGGPEPAPRLPADLADHPRYRIVEQLGAGGMGVVYKAEHRLMERTVALKIISRGLVSDADAVERFRREVKAAARLSHPNIVTAHDAEQAGDTHFLVMEFVEGITLARLIEKRGVLPITYACHFLRQAALGLHHAHERGMVHRDVKPHNLMVTRKGQLKILDFGLARLAGPAGGKATTPDLTAADVVIGTPDFLAPEQARSAQSVDVRADLYSLGCTAYFLLTGRVPFPALTAIEKLYLHCKEEAEPVERLRPEVPPEVAAVVRKLMAKRPEDRYQTAAEVAVALAPFGRISGAQLVGSASFSAVKEPAAPSILVSPMTRAEASPSAVAAGFHQKPADSESAGYKPAATAGRLRRWASAVLGMLLCVGMGVLTAVWMRPQAGADTSADRSPARGTPLRRQVLYVLSSKDHFHPGYFEVRAGLERAGFTVTVAAATDLPLRALSKGKGVPVKPNILLSQARAADYDALVVCTAISYWEFTGDREDARLVRRLIADMRAAGKPVAGLGTAVAVFAEADILRGKPATCQAWEIERVTRAGARVDRNRSVVVARDDRLGAIITGRDPFSARDMVRALLRILHDS